MRVIASESFFSDKFKQLEGQVLVCYDEKISLVSVNHPPAGDLNYPFISSSGRAFSGLFSEPVTLWISAVEHLD